MHDLSLDTDLLITGAHDFMTPYLYRQLSQAAPDTVNIWVLGTGDNAGIPVDLAKEIPTLPRAMTTVIHNDGTDTSYHDSAKALTVARNLTTALQSAPPARMVYLSSAYTGDATAFGRSKAAVEEFLAEWCQRHQVTLAILRPAMVIGTGMGGYPRQLVNSIHRGMYRHVADNAARVSVIHATDLATAAHHAIGAEFIGTITDGVNPTRHDLVEALAWRLDHKRVYTLPLKKARILARIGDYLPVTGFTTASLQRETSDDVFTSTAFTELTGIEPASVTEYLRTHTYDESSL